MYVIDRRTLRFLEVNDAALAQCGYSRQEFLELDVSDLWRDDEISKLLASICTGRPGRGFRGHRKHRRKNGEMVELEVTTHAIEFEGRDSLLVVVAGIGESPRQEAELGQAETKYRALVEQLPAITYIADYGGMGKWHYVSPQIKSILGFSSTEWLADPQRWLKQIHPEDRQQALLQEERSQKTGVPIDSQYRMLTKGGRAIWFRDFATAVLDEAGRPIHMQGVMLDITQAKEAELAHREAEERYGRLFQNAIEGVFQTTPDGRYLSANPAMARMYGFSSVEELMNSVRDIGRQVYVDPTHREQFKRLMEEFGQVENYEYQTFRKDGTKLWLTENARAVRGSDGKIRYYEGTAQDITEWKRAEIERQVTFEIIHGLSATDNLDDLLRLIHESLKKILYAENCFVAMYEPSTGMFHFPFFVDEFDSAPPPQKVGLSCTAYVFRNERAMLIPQKVFDRLVAQNDVELVGTPSPSWLGVPLRTPSATIGVLVVQHYRDENAYAERDLELLSSVGGQIAMAIERKRAESALRESEERLRILVEQLPAVLWTVGADLRFTSCLGAGLARLDLKPNEAVGMSLLDFFDAMDPGFMPIAAHRRAIAGEPVTFHSEFRGGSYACHVEPLRNAEGMVEGAICMALDVTDRKKLEEQLRQAQKMEAVGRLAGGIAHDFNNLLMVIQGYAEMLIERLGSKNPLRRNAEQIQEASQKATALTRQLLAFSRKQMLAPVVLNVQVVVSDMEKILRRLIGEDIELATVSPPGLWKIKADRSQIEQVILNLVVNSRDAMPCGGRLIIETGNVEFDNSRTHAPAVLAPGQYVMLAVTDTGCGMDLETQAHIFEPFFTTKEKGKGTGLGLATVYGIVKQSGGYIWVYSEPSRGTTFKVYLPRVEETSETAIEEPQAEQGVPQGSETVLLVEDENGVRELAKEYMESNGYTVLEARNGQEALEVARMHSGAIHLLMTDVVMPGLSGNELARELCALRPGIKVIYMSGYTDQAIVHHGILDPDTVLLQKPFTWNTLACKLRETLCPKDSVKEPG